MFDGLSIENYNLARLTMINLILATDNARHAKNINKLKKHASSNDFSKGEAKTILLKNLFHSADISNQIRKFSLAQEWSKRVTSEFFDQGDKERSMGLPITMVCDRTIVRFEESQAKFIEFFLIPLYKSISTVLP